MNLPVRIEWKRLSPLARIPSYQSSLAAGMDVHAAITEPMLLEPNRVVLVPTGFALAIPEGFEAQVRPRSGLSTKHGVTVPNAPGTIDADYRGEVMVALINLGRADFTIEPGMRVAQLVFAPVARADITEVSELSSTERGTGGFGSTGH
ncbi:MAG: dUTP diphosphatase [Planctomycetes bacterium]|nr:dUTP diphosphatase [Planctomycetota bacterium]